MRAFTGQVLGNWSQHGLRDWVSALGFSCIRLFLMWHLIANEKAQVTLLVLWATVDHGDNIWHPETALFPLIHMALKLVDRQAGT